MSNSEKIFTNKPCVILIAVFCNILWGSAFPFVKIGYELFHISNRVSEKMLFAGARFFLAGILVLILYCLLNKHIPHMHRTNTKTIILLALVQTTLQYVLFYVGLSNTTGSNGSIVNASGAFISVVLAHFIYQNDKLNSKKVIGSILGFAGVIVVTIGEGRLTFLPQGEGLIILAAATFSVGAVISKKATKLDDSMVVTGYNLTMGGAVLIVIGLLFGGRWQAVSVEGFVVLFYLIVLSAVAFTLWTMLLQYNSMGKICIYNFIIPISGSVLSAVFLNEDILQWKYLIALTLVCVGIAIINKTKRVSDNIR